VNFTDPSGLFSMSDAMTALDVAMTLDSMATAIYNSLFATPAEEAEMSEAASVWDALYITRVAGTVMDVVDLIDKVREGVKDYSHLTGSPQSHHIIPQYLCGTASQKMVKLSVPDHTLLHAEMDALALGLERAASRVAKIIKRRSDKNKITVQKIGKRKLGRVAIAGAIGAFYWAFDWMEEGIPAPNHYDKIGLGFGPESVKFIEGATSCKEGWKSANCRVRNTLAWMRLLLICGVGPVTPQSCGLAYPERTCGHVFWQLLLDRYGACFSATASRFTMQLKLDWGTIRLRRRCGAGLRSLALSWHKCLRH
jgi:hypothetical protein